MSHWVGRRRCVLPVALALTAASCSGSAHKSTDARSSSPVPASTPPLTTRAPTSTTETGNANLPDPGPDRSPFGAPLSVNEYEVWVELPRSPTDGPIGLTFHPGTRPTSIALVGQAASATACPPGPADQKLNLVSWGSSAPGQSWPCRSLGNTATTLPVTSGGEHVAFVIRVKGPSSGWLVMRYVPGDHFAGVNNAGKRAAFRIYARTGTPQRRVIDVQSTCSTSVTVSTPQAQAIPVTADALLERSFANQSNIEAAAGVCDGQLILS